jgi:hypothetical protein
MSRRRIRLVVFESIAAPCRLTSRPGPRGQRLGPGQVILVVICYFGKAPVRVFARTWSDGFGPPVLKVADRVELKLLIRLAECRMIPSSPMDPSEEGPLAQNPVSYLVTSHPRIVCL